MSLTRVHNFSISLDGFGTGEGQSHDAHFGHAGRGVRLWDGLEGLEKDYQVEATSSPSGVTHVTFTRTGV
jgi:hypothetical protein